MCSFNSESNFITIYLKLLYIPYFDFSFFILGGLLSSKAKRAKCSTHKQRVIVMLYNKVCDIVSSLSELLEIQLLTDTTILQVSFLEHFLYF